MIKSAQEAREIIEEFEKPNPKIPREAFIFQEAKGYMAALEGPEVKKLVKLLEYVESNEPADILKFTTWENDVKESLVKYREAVKP